MHRARLLVTALTLGGLGLIVSGSFLPWFRSGRRARSSYLLFDLVERVDLLPDGLARLAVGGWLFVPLAVTVVAAALLLGRLHLGAVGAAVVGLYTALLALVVRSAAGGWEAGTAVAASGGIVAMVGGAALLALLRRYAPPQADSP